MSRMPASAVSGLFDSFCNDLAEAHATGVRRRGCRVEGVVKAVGLPVLRGCLKERDRGQRPRYRMRKPADGVVFARSMSSEEKGLRVCMGAVIICGGVMEAAGDPAWGVLKKPSMKQERIVP